MSTRWLDWLQRLQALAQTGLAFSKDPYDRQRYEQLRALAAEIAAAGGGDEPARIEGLFAREQGYATPKVDVRGAVFDADGRVLLVREVNDHHRWTLPGGWADVGQSPGECVAREVREEAGVVVSVRKLAGALDSNRYRPGRPGLFHVWKLFFICALENEVAGARPDGLETSEARFFAEAELPLDELSLGRVTPAQLARLFVHYRTPDLPTDFD